MSASEATTDESATQWIDFFETKVDGARHRVEITALGPGYLEWRCVTCKTFGYTTAGYDGAPLVRQARTNHHQKARRIARR